MSARMFYRVPGTLERGGIPPQHLPKLLTEGRVIRWRSTGLEYGLFEAVICKGCGEVNVLTELTGRTR